MKHAKIFLLGLVAWASVSPQCGRGQSTYGFMNRFPLVDAPVFDADGTRLFGTNYVAMLYGGLSVDSLSPAQVYYGGRQMAPVPFTVLLGGQAGYFSGGIVEVPDTACGFFTPWLQVRAWDLRLGATYEDIVALGLGGYGESGMFQTPGGLRQPCTDPPTPASYLNGLQSFSLHPVPEPSSYLLLLAGLCALLIRRRRHH